MAEIGQTLRDARIRARIDINEVESRTKIRAKYLRAIENEEFDLLPGPVYAKSFLKTYGDYLGLDSRLLLDEYRRRYERPSDHDLRPISPLGRDRERPGARHQPRPPRVRVPPWALVGLVLVAIIVVLGVIGSGSSPKTPTPTGLRGGGSHHRRSTARHRQPVKPAVRRSRRATLVLVATGPVYVCLVNGRGRMLIPGVIFQPGQRIPVARAGRLLLTLGNANVTMRADGKAVPVTPSASAIGFLVTPTGTRPLPAAQQPRCA